MQILFHHLEPSDLAREAVEERLGDLFAKFPRLREHRVRVTLAMENSPRQAGPDLFRVRVWIDGPVFPGLRLEKTASSLYVALADVREHLLELLNRSGDRRRTLERRRARGLRVVQS